MSVFRSKYSVRIFFTFLGLFYFLLYVAKGVTFLDLDFGWHIRMGQSILQHGVPYLDPLSYTMPSYPIVDLEWITHVGMAVLYPVIGMGGLSVMFALLCLAAIGIQIPRPYKYVSFLPVLLSTTLLFSFFGVRTQVISWFFFSVLTKILFDQELWQKYRWWVPVGMFVWANMHGSFPLGILIIGVSLCFRFFQKQLTWSDCAVLLLSILGTLCNPYGYRLWTESWMQATDQNLHWRYGEWMPLIFHLDFLLYSYSICAIGFIVLFRKKISRYYLFFLGILFLGSLSSVRQTPFFILATIPALSNAFGDIYEQAKRKKGAASRMRTVFYSVSCFLLVICLWYMIDTYSSIAHLTEKEAYPQKAISYLRTHMPKKQLLTVFEWGGYTEWKLPEKKVFIDGRMPNWRMPHVLPQESSFIYEEEEKLHTGFISVRSVVEKYGIDTIMLHTVLGKSTTNPATLTNSIFQPLFPARKSLYPSVQQQLQEDGWKIVYQDTIATIYKKE